MGYGEKVLRGNGKEKSSTGVWEIGSMGGNAEGGWYGRR